MADSSLSPRTIVHVDMDAFFASIEVRDRPELQGKAVLVGGAGRRGVVAAANYEARKFGCHSAQAMSEAIRRCPHAVVVPPRHGHYVEVSKKIFRVFDRYSPLVEGISIDEAFLDFTGSERLLGPIEEVVERMRGDIFDAVALTCSFGIASCKSVAKIASDLHKPNGSTFVKAGEEAAFLAPLAVRKLWGVGKRSAERLAQLRVRTIGDLAALGQAKLEKEFGQHGLHLYRLSLGVDERELSPGRERKQVSHEDTFGEDLLSREDLHAAMLNQCMRIADRLRGKGLRGRKVSIKIRDIDFETETRQCTLDSRTDDARIIFRNACELLTRVQIANRRFRLVGVSVGDFVDSEKEEQLSLFQPEANSSEGESLQDVVSQIRGRFGEQALFAADERRRKS